MRHRAFSTLHAEYLSAAPFPVCQARTGKGGEGNTYENTYGRREIQGTARRLLGGFPLMECGASYEDFLNGLDENAVQELIDNAMISGAYPGLKIGDITTDNNNAGNW